MPASPSPAPTPESLLPRSDSLDPSRTCAGLTTSGRPCRRALPSRPTTPYCWQHAAQSPVASPVSTPYTTTSSTSHEKPPTPLKLRTSLDTLADRLGILSVGTASSRPPPSSRPPHSSHHRPRPPSLCATLCCFTGAAGRTPDDDYYEIVRHRTRIRPAAPPTPTPGPRPSTRPAGPLSLIPPSLPSPTQSLLAAELAKPIAPADHPAYIYIFWLTPSAIPPPAAAERWLDPAAPPPRAPAERLLLKIGRARNVHRRLHEWGKQCGTTPSLLRVYPYAPGGGGRMVPHAHRVERLVHLELEGQRVQSGECGACGRVHREWFEVAATRQGVRGVDEVVRRWVGWAEGL